MCTCARICPRVYWVGLLWVPTRVRLHLYRPPERLGCEAQARGLRRGKSLRRRFKLLFSAGGGPGGGTGPGPHSVVDLGGNGPNPSWGSRGDPGLWSERRWRRRVPEIYFQGRSQSSCSRRSWLKNFLRCCCVRGGGEPLREPSFSETSSETLSSPQRPSPAGFSKRRERWPRCKNEDTSQALLQGPEGLRFWGNHQARWKILKYILCVL